ncbi:hypothetical protein FRC02_010442 [Tulasnella sp. 418]|nr:hypothetical protein FRC02_010442 [Tulasnella sp. 418]
MYTLPVELIQEVGSYFDRAELKEFASTSRGLRQSLLPQLLREVNISSIDQLTSLSETSIHTTSLVRVLNVTLGLEFFDEWVDMDVAGSLLAVILRRCPNLRTFRYRLINSPFSTPWSRFALSTPKLRGAALGVEVWSDIELPRLSTLHLEGIQSSDFEPILRRCPNLSNLYLSLPDGLSYSEFASLQSALLHAPELKKLSVGLEGWDAYQAPQKKLPVVGMLREIAECLPSVEVLDLRTQIYELYQGCYQNVSFESSSAGFEDFVSAISLFPKLRKLHLPLQSDTIDPIQASMDIASQSPELNSISWALKSSRDEHFDIQRSNSQISILRNDPIGINTTIRSEPSSDKPSIISNIYSSVSTLFAASSMFFAFPVFVTLSVAAPSALYRIIAS